MDGEQTSQDLSGRVALITGSSRGIGAAIARRFARHGATVVIHGRNVSAIAALRDEIERSGGKALGASADVLRFAELESLREHVEREAGPIDVLVANAGGSFTNPGTPFEDLTEEGWHASVDGNLTATF